MRKIQRLVAVGALATLTTVAGACSNAQQPATGPQTGEAPVSIPQTEPGQESTARTSDGVTQISDIFGPACDQIPREGSGSAQNMVGQPVATAAGSNPQLETLTKAITAANLPDTLNSAPTLTVFAPSDSAFQQFEAKNPGLVSQLTTSSDAASSDGRLVKILKYHVVDKRYDAAGLVQAGTVQTLDGGKIQIGGTPAAPTVNGAQVMCGNIPTKNATVFVIGQVLSPPAT